MEAKSPVALLIDATGGGACQLDTEGRMVTASPGFIRLTGLAWAGAGTELAGAIDALPPLATIPTHASSDAARFSQIGSDGVRRVLLPVRVELDGTPWLALIDRTDEDRLRRKQDQLDRQIDDLQAELKARARAGVGPRVRTMRELASRLEEALGRAQRYDHPVTVAHVGFIGDDQQAAGKAVLGSVRAVDEVGEAGAGRFAVVLPHTDMPGGKVAATRILGRLEGSGFTTVAIGVAQAKKDETASDLAARAESACTQAREQGGGLLLAVDVL